MANSEFQYVRHFETWDALAPSNWIVIRIDGRGFSKLCQKYHFTKPNDRRALELMNAAAAEVVRNFVDVVLAYGQSDEYSFVFHESTTLFERRASKLVSSVVSQFTAEYCLLWGRYMVGLGDLERPWPGFDGRAVAYPKRGILRDYLSWRQADCHINNLYNTTFWNMVLRGGMTPTDAEAELKGTLSSDKNEILFSRFQINYNDEDEMFRKGTVIYRAYGEDGGGEGGVEGQAGEQRAEKRDGKGGSKVVNPNSKSQLEKEKKRKQKARLAVEHCDIIRNEFWEKRPYIMAPRGGNVFEE